MPLNKAVNALPAMVIAVAALGCQEPLGPTNLTGSYVLERVASDSLPTTLVANQDVTISVMADTLRFSQSGLGSESALEVVHYAATGASDTVAWTTMLTVHVERSHFAVRIGIGYSCPANADCAPPPQLSGVLFPGGLVVDQALGLRVPLTYRRVSGAG